MFLPISLVIRAKDDKTREFLEKIQKPLEKPTTRTYTKSGMVFTQNLQTGEIVECHTIMQEWKQFTKEITQEK